MKKPNDIQQLQEGADFVDFILLNLDSGFNIEQSFSQATSFMKAGTLKNIAQRICNYGNIGLSFGESIDIFLKENKKETIFKDILENLRLSIRLGSPLIEILTHLSIHFRILASYRLEEIGNEAPVKMIFPLVIFIFPVIFILLGSGAIDNLIRSFNF